MRIESFRKNQYIFQKIFVYFVDTNLNLYSLEIYFECKNVQEYINMELFMIDKNMLRVTNIVCRVEIEMVMSCLCSQTNE